MLPSSVSPRLPRLVHALSTASGNEGLDRSATFLPKSRRLSVLSWKFQESLRALVRGGRNNVNRSSGAITWDINNFATMET